MNLQDRALWIKEKVSLKQFFDLVGVSYQDMNIAHQIRCPFHGTDIHASARFFPDQNNGSGSFWCWACNDGGDILWFVEQWYGLDNVVKACEKIEDLFALGHTQDDSVKEFYRHKHKFDEASTQVNLVNQLLLYFEVQACGRTHKKDPTPVDEGWLSDLRRACPSHFQTWFSDFSTAMWKQFDGFLEELPKGTYIDAVTVLEAWRDTFKHKIQEVYNAESQRMGASS